MYKQSDLFAADFANAQEATLSNQLFQETQVSTSRGAGEMAPGPAPYSDAPVGAWRAITRNLVRGHPLQAAELLHAVNAAWQQLWSMTLATANTNIALSELELPASALGSIFERLLALELAKAHPGEWRAGQGHEKDLTCVSDDRYSIELKTSSQLGYKIFGNRSYNQSTGDLAKKDKSGFYLTVNFYRNKLTLVRFGWLDADDWQSQKSASGQAATLKDTAYQHKLVTLPGSYILDGPLQLVDGVGPRNAAELAALGIFSIRELIEASGLSDTYRKLQYAAMRHSERPELQAWANTMTASTVSH